MRKNFSNRKITRGGGNPPHLKEGDLTMRKANDVTIKYPNYKKQAVLRCECCGERAEVMSIYGEFERSLCAKCYVKEELPKMNVIMSDGNADFDGAWVGQSYYIDKYSYDEFEPYEYGWKGCSFLKKIADKIMVIGSEEVSGKRTLKIKVVLKPEFNRFEYRYFTGIFNKARLERSRYVMERCLAKDLQKGV